ncbi:DUF2716 domain-containing protein [Rhodococcus sp. KRD197]|uniref:DUF2716 domain-containing protein n=1 Tax=Rhodococcus sp. KRD197 TaxID=2729731 RepID=UPI0019D04CB2|nr:DUF2716 domain-containing protein [Rhodococcus sp. KRD197]
MATKRTRDFRSALPVGWSELGKDLEAKHWATFKGKFGFRPGTKPDAWPAIAEPAPSMAFDLGADDVRTGSSFAARVDAINAEALRCFVTEFADDPTFVVLDWQHMCYRFDANAHAVAGEDAEWRVPVYPNGDYYIFAQDDFREGTFGHPWEQTLCVYGPRMVTTLGHTLTTWLTTLRVDGHRTD